MAKKKDTERSRERNKNEIIGKLVHMIQMYAGDTHDPSLEEVHNYTEHLHKLLQDVWFALIVTGIKQQGDICNPETMTGRISSLWGLFIENRNKLAKLLDVMKKHNCVDDPAQPAEQALDKRLSYDQNKLVEMIKETDNFRTVLMSHGISPTTDVALSQALEQLKYTIGTLTADKLSAETSCAAWQESADMKDERIQALTQYIRESNEHIVALVAQRNALVLSNPETRALVAGLIESMKDPSARSEWVVPPEAITEPSNE